MSAPKPERISLREFARRSVCDEKQVRRAIAKGVLHKDGAGLLDASLVKAGWRKSTRRPLDRQVSAGADMPENVRVPHAEGDETPAQAAERIVLSGAPYDRIEAERIKENYLALLRQLEYDQKSGAVVAVADVAGAVGKQFARLRTRLLAIPAEQAPRLHRLKTVPEVQDALQDTITEALEELSGYKPPPAS